MIRAVAQFGFVLTLVACSADHLQVSTSTANKPPPSATQVATAAASATATATATGTSTDASTDTATETATGSATATDTSTASATATATLPAGLSLTAPAASAPTWGCFGPLEVALIDAHGTGVTTATDVGVTLSGSGTTTYHANADCTSTVTTVTIGANAARAEVYLRDTVSETAPLGASAASLTGAALNLPVAPACIAKPSGLVSWWDGDHVSGSTFTDLKGSNDGTLMNSLSPTAANGGKVGAAFSAAAPGEYGTIPDASSLAPGSAFTVGGWFNLTAGLSVPRDLVTKWSAKPTMQAGAFAAFDASTIGSGTNKGYAGAVFDGKYIYYVPYVNTSGTANGRVLRYNTQASFTDSGAWSVFDLSLAPLSVAGFIGGAFDGRYVYFSPANSLDALTAHAKVVRYDTTDPTKFTDSGSWEVYDASAITNHKGYAGMVFDGQYLYLVPGYEAGAAHGSFLRFNTGATSFSDINAWTLFDAMSAPNFGGAAAGYYGGAFDGRYVYFAPYLNGGNYHGTMIRFDTSNAGGFSAKASWEIQDRGSTNDSNNNPLTTKGFRGAVFDGNYVYFVPFALPAATADAHVVRFDTGQSSFASGWLAFDAGGVAAPAPIGFDGAIFDGRYVYFIPYEYDISAHSFSGRMLRYDTAPPGGFSQSANWQSIDVNPTDGLAAEGYRGAAYDGRFLYFAPERSAVNTFHATALRYDTTGDGGAYRLGLTSLGPRFTISTGAGAAAAVATVQAVKSVTSGWHYLAGAYDGQTLRLNMDGADLAQTSWSGSLPASTSPVQLGGFDGIGNFQGLFDEVQLYDRALAGGELKAIFGADVHGMCKP